ncbi:MAG: dipeptide ABC transporter ATP-binding protein [Anaerolineae bacterium]|nr:dipeptide ABC transporter ATP-binding protein [Anaerolineae bacterium]
MTSPATTAERTSDLLSVERLVKYFPVKGGLFQTVKGQVRAVDDVSFTVRQGETIGLVGESGCGKTTLGRAVLQLIRPTSGKVIFEGRDLTHLPAPELKGIRKDMQLVFQNPYSSLDPRLPIGESIAEGLALHEVGTSSGDRRAMVREVLQKVGMHPDLANRFPHEFSGGQRQRIGIARALVLRPKLIVCDEPVSALDVSIQSQVLNLLRGLQREFGLTYMFIAHNLSVVEHISDRVAVMYLGKMVELADRIALYAAPTHPYTQALMSAIPVPDPTIRRARVILKGDVPSPINPPAGCRFHPRCPIAVEECRHVEPAFREIRPGHWAACHRAEESAQAMAAVVNMA